MSDNVRDERVERNDPTDALNDQVTDVRLLNMGANQLTEFVVNGKTAIAATNDGLYIAPEYLGNFQYSISDGVAYVIGFIESNSLPVDINADGIFIAGETITGQTMQRLSVRTEDRASGPAKIHIETS